MSTKMEYKSIISTTNMFHKLLKTFDLIANQHECTIKLWLNPLILNEKYLKSKQN